MASKVQPRPALPKAKPLTEAEQRASRRHQENIAEDGKAIAQADLCSPFKNVGDAVNRLLPFHLFASQDGEDADFDDQNGTLDPSVLCSRREAWLDLCLRKTAELTSKADIICKKIDELEKKQNDDSQIPVEERYLLQRLLVADAQQALMDEKQRMVMYRGL